jgi:hypothetical protein
MGYIFQEPFHDDETRKGIPEIHSHLELLDIKSL